MVIFVVIVLSVLIYGVKRCSSSRLTHSKYTQPHTFFILDQKDGNSPETQSEVNVEMQRCGAYEVVRLSRQRVTMKDNPAYVDVNLQLAAY